MLHVASYGRRHYRCPWPLGTYSCRYRQERRGLCCNQWVEQLPEFGLRGRPLFRTGRNCPPACRWNRADAQTQWGDADMFFPMGLLRLPHFVLWGKECGRCTLLVRVENGTDRYLGGRLHLWYSRFRCGHGVGICRRKRGALSSCHLKIYTDMAAQLHSQPTRNAFVGGKDETYS